MASITLNVSKEFAAYIQEHGFAEICTRTSKKRFLKFQKVVVDKVKSEGIIDDFKSEKCYKLLKEQTKNLKAVNESLKNLSGNVDQLLSGMNALQGLQWMNLGMTTVNMGVSVAGFMIMAEKLDDISQKIDELKKELDEVKDEIEQIKEMQLEETIFIPRKVLISETKEICRAEQKKREVSREQLSDIIKKYRIYLDTLLELYQKRSKEIILDIIFELLPIFTNLIVLYYEKYYDIEGKDLHPLHSEWMQIYQVLGGEKFMEVLRDYYFLEKGMSNHRVSDILDGTRLLVESYRTTITDTTDLMIIVGSVQKYHEVMQAIQRQTDCDIKNYIDELKADDKVSNEVYDQYNYLLENSAAVM